MATLGAPLATGHHWKGWLPELADWGSTGSGIKNGFLKPAYHVVDLMKLGGYEISPAWMNVRHATKEAKNLLAVAEVPGKINKLWQNVEKCYDRPSFEAGGTIFFSSVDMVSPVCDLTEWWHARVAPLSSELMTFVSRINAVALLISMVKASVDCINKIGTAVSDMYAASADVEKQYTIILRNSIDLIKNISYIVLASIALISAFFVAIAAAGTYILLASTNAVVFTIIGEFTRRALPLPEDSRKG